MTTFDASVAYYDEGSPTMKTYRSYACSSRKSYLLPDNLRVNKYYYPWSNVSRDRFFDSKPPHISQLRNILSETISDITKNSSLKSDDSVELTLEVELVQRLTTPSNSLVEVTIIQHKPEENGVTGNKSEQVLEYKNKFLVDRNSSLSDCPSQKKRNWFERVIKRYYNKSPEKISLKGDCEKVRKSKMTQHTPVNNTILNGEKNTFITVLPEHTTDKNANILKQNHRESQTNKTAGDGSSREKNKSIVKKFSNMFSPTSKGKKSNTKKSALNKSRMEEEHLESVAEREDGHKDKVKTTPVPKIGNFVGNVVNDALETFKKPHSSVNGSAPIHYQSKVKPAVERKTKKSTKLRSNNKQHRKVVGSLSDTCLEVAKLTIIRSSSSMDDCSRQKRFVRKKVNQPKQIRALKQNDKIKNWRNGNEENIHCWNINEKGDGKRQKHYKTGSKHPLGKQKRKKKLNSKYSAIDWNGQKYKVNKEVKLRIEQIIFNELQNLALKEGMECDVSPLPSADTSDNSFISAEKISSFICKVDINNDKRFREVRPHKSKSLRTNPSFVIEKKRSGKNLLKRKSELKIVSRAKNMTTDQTNSSINTFESTLRHRPTKLSRSKSETEIGNEIVHCEVEPLISRKSGIQEDRNSKHTSRNNNNNKCSDESELTILHDPGKSDDIEIKYVNNKTNQWSDESVVDNSENKKTDELPAQSDQEKPQDTDINGLTFKHISSGFVRRIESNDSSWNDLPSGVDLKASNRCCTKTLNLPTRLIEEDWTKKTISTTSNESEKHLQIEVDLEGLETILNEAKLQDCGKVVLNAKCKRGVKNKVKSREFTGKNSASYTENLLIKAAQKLEKYRREKQST